MMIVLSIYKTVDKEYVDLNDGKIDVTIFEASLIIYFNGIGFSIHNADDNVDFSSSNKIESMKYNKRNQFETNTIN